LEATKQKTNKQTKKQAKNKGPKQDNQNPL
jgi:hypothetical protein